MTMRCWYTNLTPVECHNSAQNIEIGANFKFPKLYQTKMNELFLVHLFLLKLLKKSFIKFFITYN